VHEDHAEVVVVPWVSGGVSALAEVARGGELVAARGIAAAFVLEDASNTIAADLVSGVNAASQASLVDSETSADEGGVGHGGGIGIDVAVLDRGLSGGGLSLDAATRVGVLVLNLSSSAVSVARARAGDVNALRTIDGTALGGAGIIVHSGVAASANVGVVAVPNGEGVSKLGEFGGQAASLASRADCILRAVEGEDNVGGQEGARGSSRASAGHSDGRDSLLGCVTALLGLTTERLSTAAALAVGVDANTNS
jgi:hypothetical protein